MSRLLICNYIAVRHELFRLQTPVICLINKLSPHSRVSIVNRPMANQLPHPVIKQLKAWRTSRDLSQSQAVRILVQAGLPVALPTLQQWEIARSSPRPLMATALEKFLAEREKQTAIGTNTTVAPAIERLKRWRNDNNLSTTQAVAALTESGLPVKLNTLQRWESGLRHPSDLVANAIANFLDRVQVANAQQRLYRRAKELQKELAAAHRSATRKPERDVIQIVDNLMHVFEDLLETTSATSRNKNQDRSSL
jgi:transcriptional regulator with XRE-family HTH domain